MQHGMNFLEGLEKRYLFFSCTKICNNLNRNKATQNGVFASSLHLEWTFEIWQYCFCLEPLLLGAKCIGHLCQHLLEQFYNIP